MSMFNWGNTCKLGAVELVEWDGLLTEAAEETFPVIPAVTTSENSNFQIDIDPTHRIIFALCEIQSHQVLKRLKNKYSTIFIKK